MRTRVPTGIWRGQRRGNGDWRWFGQGKQVHGRMDDICYTMFYVPMETRPNAPTPRLRPYLSHPGSTRSLTTCSQRGSRQARVVGAGFSSFAAAPLPSRF